MISPIPTSLDITSEQLCLEGHSFFELLLPDAQKLLPINGVDEWMKGLVYVGDDPEKRIEDPLIMSLVGFNMRNNVEKSKTDLRNKVKKSHPGC